MSLLFACSYLVNFMLDSTVGLLIIYTVLSVVSCVVNWRNIVPLRSGEYGECVHLQ